MKLGRCQARRKIPVNTARGTKRRQLVDIAFTCGTGSFPPPQSDMSHCNRLHLRYMRDGSTEQHRIQKTPRARRGHKYAQ